MIPTVKHTSLLCILLALALVLIAGCTKSQVDTAPPPIDPGSMADAVESTSATPDEQEGSKVEWVIASDAFANGERIPEKYTADGEDVSPPLTWTIPPEGAKELALICDDPDAPAGTWTHWVLYGLAPDETSLPEAMPKTETPNNPECVQGMNTWPKLGYWGPAPPPGKTHRYQFTIYAVSKELRLAPKASKDELLKAMKGAVLGKATIEGTYSR